MPSAPTLQSVVELLRSDRILAALDHLLMAWSEDRCPELAQRIERLGKQIDRSLPTLKNTRALRDEWLDLAARRRPADLGRLLAALPMGSIATLRQRVELLELFPHDPRVPAVVLPAACGYSSRSADTLRTRAFRLVKEIADGRSLTIIDEHLDRWPKLAATREALMAMAKPEPQRTTELADIDVELARLLNAPAPEEQALWAQQAPLDQHTQEAELLTQILANPDDDEVRMVYGDCLAERGDARGELIMLQMKPERTVKEERRVRQLVKEHGREWIRPLDLVVDPKTMRFERGFLHACTVTFSTKKQRKELFEHPLWATVRELTTRDDDELFLRHAGHLRVAVGISPSGLSAMAGLSDPVPLERAAGAPRKTHGPETGICCRTPKDWKAACAVGALTLLRELHLQFNSAPPDDLAWLFDSPLGKELQRVRVGEVSFLGWQGLMERRPDLLEVAAQGGPPARSITRVTVKLVRDRRGTLPHMVLETEEETSGADQIARAVRGYPVAVKLPKLTIAYIGPKRRVSDESFRGLATEVEDLFKSIVLPSGQVHEEGDYTPAPLASSAEILEGMSPGRQLTAFNEEATGAPLLLSLERPLEHVLALLKGKEREDQVLELVYLAHTMSLAACHGGVKASVGWPLAGVLREAALDAMGEPEDPRELCRWRAGHVEATLYRCLAGDWGGGLALIGRISRETIVERAELGDLNLLTALQVATLGAGDACPLAECSSAGEFFTHYENHRELNALLHGCTPELFRRLCSAIHPWVAESALLFRFSNGSVHRQPKRRALRRLLDIDPERPLAVFLQLLGRSPYNRSQVVDYSRLARVYEDPYTYREFDRDTLGAHLVEVALTAAARLLAHTEDYGIEARLDRWLTCARDIGPQLVEGLLGEPRFAGLRARAIV
ncbi:MAG: TIGR02996 domain-containing protein [Deltaproteobacteria bacterium]|nr:TIGR02996 domain-containing protein [Deltaproteobacteria bacterium]